ncbi:hypothetical protein HZ326_21886 [Fusarium oxysporum f. sp. albedinis]|nr:Aspartate aminotransferase, cytoplasmic [Fusarium oxysporum f. sp. albedinis]KAJ0135077.1 hypothetical protein HZ326_21886 [Fusarium oxysporum f. sp. albedinis]
MEEGVRTLQLACGRIARSSVDRGRRYWLTCQVVPSPVDAPLSSTSSPLPFGCAFSPSSVATCCRASKLIHLLRFLGHQSPGLLFADFPPPGPRIPRTSAPTSPPNERTFPGVSPEEGISDRQLKYNYMYPNYNYYRTYMAPT